MAKIGRVELEAHLGTVKRNLRLYTTKKDLASQAIIGAISLHFESQQGPVGPISNSLLLLDSQPLVFINCTFLSRSG